MSAQPAAPASKAKSPFVPPPRVIAEMGVPIAVLVIVVAMITPLPGLVLDLFIVCNITLSVIVLLVSMYILRPVEFSVFPTTLLLLTLFRLALNISSSRLILLEGNVGTSAAGHVIEAFGQFVVGGNYVIGTVIFLVLIAIQYVVINHGAVRISEVTARFTLDALPGKQMSIDSDLNAGLIDEAEAKTRRKLLAAEAEFYGAMDGASRFTQRDAIASILITGINIVAGLLIGIFSTICRSHGRFKPIPCTIGDGLVTVIPALMISISGGLIVTRAASRRPGSGVSKTVLGNAQPLMLASLALGELAILPGSPGSLPSPLRHVGYAGWRLQKESEKQLAEPPVVAKAPAKDRVESLLKLDPLAVEIGLGLVRHVEGGAGSPLLRRISAIRKQLAGDLGYVLPPVRVTDNLSLKAREYVVYLKGAEIARGELPAGCDLAIKAQADCPEIEGRAVKDPAFRVARRLDSQRSEGRGAQEGLFGGGRAQRSRYASRGDCPASRARAVLSAGRQALSRPGGGRSPQGGRGSGSQAAAAFERPARHPEPAAREGVDSRWRFHPRSA